MYDPPHLLKSIRNNLKNGYIFNGNKVSMKNIETFYEEKIKFNLQLAPKLQKRHMELTTFTKMRVDLAAQTLSQSVCSGIRTLVSQGILPNETLYTADFCSFFNNIFDISNSKSESSSNIYKKSLTKSNIPLQYLKSSLIVLEHMEYLGKRYISSLPCILGWR